MNTKISTVTLSKSVQTQDGSWTKCEVTSSSFVDYGKAVKDLVGEINFALVELDDAATMPETPEADEANVEIEAEKKAAAAAKKKEAAEKKAAAAAKKKEAAEAKEEATTEKKPKSTKAKKEVPYDRTIESLKKKFAEVLTAVLPSWKQDAKPQAGELSKSLNGLAMLDSDGLVLSGFEKAIRVGLSDFLPKDNEEEDGL